jgi:hypothetical protein
MSQLWPKTGLLNTGNLFAIETALFSGSGPVGTMELFLGRELKPQKPGPKKKDK